MADSTQSTTSIAATGSNFLTTDQMATVSLSCGLAAISYPNFVVSPLCALVAMISGFIGLKSKKRKRAIAGIGLAICALTAFSAISYSKKAVFDDAHSLVINGLPNIQTRPSDIVHPPGLPSEPAVESSPVRRPQLQPSFNSPATEEAHGDDVSPSTAPTTIPQRSSFKRNQKQNTYTDREHSFSIDFPDGWAIKRSLMANTIIKAVHRDSKNRLAQISIAAYALPSSVSDADAREITADEMWESSRQEFSGAEVQRLGSGAIEIQSRHAVWNVVEIKEPSLVASFSKHYHLIKGKYMYRVSAMADHEREFFDVVLPIMDEAIATLTFDQ